MQRVMEKVVNGRLSALSEMGAPPIRIQVSLLLHALRYLELRVKSKTLHSDGNARSVLRIGFVVQTVAKGWSMLITKYLDV